MAILKCVCDYYHEHVYFTGLQLIIVVIDGFPVDV